MYWTRVSSCNRILIVSGVDEGLLSIFSATTVSITRQPIYGGLDLLRVVFMLACHLPAVSSEYLASALSTLVVVCDDKVKFLHGQLYPRSANGSQSASKVYLRSDMTSKCPSESIWTKAMRSQLYFAETAPMLRCSSDIQWYLISKIPSLVLHFAKQVINLDRWRLRKLGGKVLNDAQSEIGKWGCIIGRALVNERQILSKLQYSQSDLV